MKSQIVVRLLRGSKISTVLFFFVSSFFGFGAGALHAQTALLNIPVPANALRWT